MALRGMQLWELKGGEAKGVSEIVCEKEKKRRVCSTGR